MVDAHFLIGELFQSQGLFDKAIESFQQAAELQPDNPMVHLRLEAAILELDQRDKPQ
jgi:tetratricopeptide (TPR) repeat protein